MQFYEGLMTEGAGEPAAASTRPSQARQSSTACDFQGRRRCSNDPGGTRDIAAASAGVRWGYVMRRIWAIGVGLFLLVGGAQAATLRIGLNEDPDALDPARGGTFVGRIIFAAVCDKLVDLDAKNNFVPQLATSWEWSPDNLALTAQAARGREIPRRRDARRRRGEGQPGALPHRARERAQGRVETGHLGGSGRSSHGARCISRSLTRRWSPSCRIARA